MTANGERMRITIRAPTVDGIRELLRTEDLDLNCGGPLRTENGDWTVEAYVSRDESADGR